MNDESPAAQGFCSMLQTVSDLCQTAGTPKKVTAAATRGNTASNRQIDDEKQAQQASRRDEEALMFHRGFGDLFGLVLTNFFRTNGRGWTSIHDIATEAATWRLQEQFAVFTHDGKEFCAQFFLVGGPRGETWLKFFIDIDDEDLDDATAFSLAMPQKLDPQHEQAYSAVTAHFPGYHAELYAQVHQPVTTMVFRSGSGSMTVKLDFDSSCPYPYAH